MSTEYNIIFTVDRDVPPDSPASMDLPDTVKDQIGAHFHKILNSKGFEAAKEAVMNKVRLPEGITMDFERVVGPQTPTAMVKEFHETFKHPVHVEPFLPDTDRANMRLTLIEEEADELAQALDMPETTADQRKAKLVAIADALGDLQYVVEGMAHECGIPLTPVVAEIHSSNMSKLGADGKPIYRADGKVLKGQNFREPNLAGVLFPGT